MTIEPAVAVIARKQVSRRKLLDAARALFTEKGYHDTRPQDIARAAGVGHGTFYLHFADKRECFLAFVDEAAAEVHDCISRRTENAEDVEGYVRGVFDGFQSYNIEHPGVLAAAMVDATVIGGGENTVPLMHRWAHDWTDRIEELMDKKMVSGKIDPRVAGHAIIGAIQQSFIGGMRDGLGYKEVLDGLIEFIVRALGSGRAS